MKPEQNRRLSSGIEGLDEILHGGVLPNRSYLIRGGPGTGKTTVGLHFLTAGPENDGRSLFVSLGESESNVNKECSIFRL
jgi:circadian clock protein KaiC